MFIVAFILLLSSFISFSLLFISTETIILYSPISVKFVKKVIKVSLFTGRLDTSFFVIFLCTLKPFIYVYS